MWVTVRLMPDFKTIAHFCKDCSKAIRDIRHQLVALCRQLGLFTEILVAIDGGKFKGVANKKLELWLAARRVTIGSAKCTLAGAGDGLAIVHTDHVVIRYRMLYVRLDIVRLDVRSTKLWVGIKFDGHIFGDCSIKQVIAPLREIVSHQSLPLGIESVVMHCAFFCERPARHLSFTAQLLNRCDWPPVYALPFPFLHESTHVGRQ